MVDRQVQRWAASGAMALTGWPARQPLGPPDGLVDGVERLARSFPGLDALALLGERAALMGLWRRGTTSCGGSCRLLPAADGRWLAVSLPRAEDRDLLPAWLSLDAVPATEPAAWAAVGHALRHAGAGGGADGIHTDAGADAGADADAMLDRAVLLGLPVARVGEMTGPAVVTTPLGQAPSRDVRQVVVADLSGLWAGPLCGDLLARAGADVVKVESTTRPDGARRGPREFFDLLNGRKRSIALDFGDAADRRRLHRLVASADVVIEASRPRALEQLGIDAAGLVAGGGPQVWISITGYGRRGAGAGAGAAGRVGFGDDAAAAGGLVVWTDSTPAFCADAVADPLTGLTAAHACLEALAGGGRWLLDVSLAGVAAGLAGQTLPVPPDVEVEVAQPRARRPEGAAPAMGADTAQVMARLVPGI
jgi:hypothetical protein